MNLLIPIEYVGIKAQKADTIVGWAVVVKKPSGGELFLKVIIPHDQKQNGFHQFRVTKNGIKVSLPQGVDPKFLKKPIVAKNVQCEGVFKGHCTVISYQILHKG